MLRLPDSEVRYALNGARTVEAALAVADLTSDNDDRIRVNGDSADMETELSNGDVLTVSGRIEGAR